MIKFFICANLESAFYLNKVIFRRILHKGWYFWWVDNSPVGKNRLTCHLRFSWNFQDLKIVVWKDIPVQNLLPERIFFYPENSVKNWTKNAKSRKIANILETARNIVNTSKFQPVAQLLSVLRGITVFLLLFFLFGYIEKNILVRNWTLFLR